VARGMRPTVWVMPIPTFETITMQPNLISDMLDEGKVLIRMGLLYAKMGVKEEACKCFQASKTVFARLCLPNMVAMIDKLIEDTGL
jgi:hypothetical protein